VISERVERRALGAIEFVDALTGARVRHALKVEADALRLRLSPSWLYVIRGADGLSAHTEAFDEPPGTPEFQKLKFPLKVSDPQRRYLARGAVVKLPRKNQPVSDPESLLRPVQIQVYPSMARPIEASWASARVFVYTTVSGKRIAVANALLKLTPSLPDAAPVRALTDSNGEALLAVIGVPPVLPSGGAADGDPDVVYTRTFSAALVLVLDEDVVRQSDGDPPPLPNPDLIEERLAAANPAVREVNPPALEMSAGIAQRVDVEVTL
jgi:hypothetical protein